jgi:hypothetical protein
MMTVKHAARIVQVMPMEMLGYGGYGWNSAKTVALSAVSQWQTNGDDGESSNTRRDVSFRHDSLAISSASSVVRAKASACQVWFRLVVAEHAASSPRNDVFTSVNHKVVSHRTTFQPFVLVSTPVHDGSFATTGREMA